MALRYVKYLQVPHVAGGRSFTGADCFGLVCLFYQEEFSIELSASVPYTEYWYKDQPALIIRSATSAGFKRVKTQLQHGDVVVLKEEGALKHLAVYLAPGYLLHNVTTGTYCEPLAKGSGSKIRAIYRHKDMVPTCA